MKPEFEHPEPSEGDENLTSYQREALKAVRDEHAHLNELVKAFPDPADAFVCSPVQLSMKQLAELYIDLANADNVTRFPSELRARSRTERWVERRAVFQAKRASTRRDAILNGEAQIWAMMGLEFHSKRIHGMWDRYEALSAYVMDQLERCEAGERMFGQDVRDAVHAVGVLETQLADLMPKLGIPEKAKDLWSHKAGDRSEIVSRIEERMRTAAGAKSAGNVYLLVHNSDAGGDVDRRDSDTDTTPTNEDE